MLLQKKTDVKSISSSEFAFNKEMLNSSDFLLTFSGLRKLTKAQCSNTFRGSDPLKVFLGCVLLRP